MRRIAILSLGLLVGSTVISCKKKGCTDPNALNYEQNAKKDDGSCTYETDPYTIPTSYSFLDAAGNNTVDYSGQTDRLNQLRELVAYMEGGTVSALDAQAMKDMFANTGGNGNGYFSFNSSKQLKDKCFSLDQTLIESWMDDLSAASQSFALTATNGQAGLLTSGTSTYLFDANGKEHVELIEKGIMGAVFMYQALNVYFGAGKMDVDNSSAVDPSSGLYYTTMQHHFDEAFGYFGVSPDFPNTIPSDFWGKYCNSQHSNLNSNADMMNNFLKGRAAIGANYLSDRDAAILAIRTEWEDITANQAIKYLDQAVTYFGTDDAKFLHVLSEAYAFAWNIRYAPVETRRMNPTEHSDLMNLFKPNFWNMTIADINAIKNELQTKY